MRARAKLTRALGALASLVMRAKDRGVPPDRDDDGPSVDDDPDVDREDPIDEPDTDPGDDEDDDGAGKRRSARKRARKARNAKGSTMHSEKRQIREFAMVGLTPAERADFRLLEADRGARRVSGETTREQIAAGALVGLSPEDAEIARAAAKITDPDKRRDFILNATRKGK